MKARIAGSDIHYDARGQGPAVLLLHAFPLNLGMWDATALALAPSHQVLRFDARGFGQSAPGDGPLTMERIADDAAAVLDHAGVSQAVFCGVSMGGYACFAAVRRHADRIRGLVLSDTRTAADTAEAQEGRRVLAEKVRREGPEAVAEAMLPKLVGATTHGERKEVVARLRAMVLSASRAGVANALLGVAARADSGPTLREVRVPTLVVSGTEDAITPVSDAEAIHRGIAGSRLEVLPRVGHLPPLEDPAAFNDVLKSFLADAKLRA